MKRCPTRSKRRHAGEGRVALARELRELDFACAGQVGSAVYLLFRQRLVMVHVNSVRAFIQRATA